MEGRASDYAYIAFIIIHIRSITLILRSASSQKVFTITIYQSFVALVFDFLII